MMTSRPRTRSGPRCQDTIFGDVNAQTRFESTSIQSIDPPLSRGYTLGSGEDINAVRLKLVLSVLVSAVKHMLMLPVQVSAVEESDGFAEIIDFLKASSVSYALTVNPIQALVDKKRVIVTESSIRRDLYLDDAEGTDCLPTATIFEELARMGYEKPSQKLTFYKAFFSPCGKYLFHTYYSRLKVLDLQTAKDAQAKEIASLKKRIQRLKRRKMSRPTGLKKLKKIGMIRRVESSEDQESLGAPEDASKLGRSIEDIDVDVDVSLVDETQERQDDDLMFDTRVLEDDEMHVEAKVDRKNEQSTKPDDSTAGEAVTTASVDDSVVPTTIDSKDKGKGIMIEPEVPLKRKDQIALDEQIARDIQANYDGGGWLIDWMAERLYSKEREELTDEEKAKLFMKLMEKRRTAFAATQSTRKEKQTSY
ncbi:hypothetical protein Tco_0912872 [Tanacetum coccineum]